MPEPSAATTARPARTAKIAKIARLALASLAFLWLAYAVALDVRYRRFPEVLLGAVQILVAVWLLLWIAALCWRGMRRLGRLATGSSAASAASRTRTAPRPPREAER